MHCDQGSPRNLSGSQASSSGELIHVKGTKQARDPNASRLLRDEICLLGARRRWSSRGSTRASLPVLFDFLLGRHRRTPRRVLLDPNVSQTFRRTPTNSVSGGRDFRVVPDAPRTTLASPPGGFSQTPYRSHRPALCSPGVHEDQGRKRSSCG